MHLEAFGCVRTRSENFGDVGPENAIFAFLEGILTARAILGPCPDLCERYWPPIRRLWGGMPISLITNIE